ncbi:MAG: hypothetical protein U0641_06860 [Anaerolineae bacterium]
MVAESDLPDTADLALKANLGQIGVYTSELEERDLVRRRIHPTRDEQLGMRLQRRPSTTVTRPTGKGGIVLGPFVIQGVLERGRVGASDIVSGELRQGAMASFDLRLIRRLMRANVTRLNAQADQPQGQERGEGVGAAPHGGVVVALEDIGQRVPLAECLAQDGLRLVPRQLAVAVLGRDVDDLGGDEYRPIRVTDVTNRDAMVVSQAHAFLRIELPDHMPDHRGRRWGQGRGERGRSSRLGQAMGMEKRMEQARAREVLVAKARVSVQLGPDPPTAPSGMLAFERQRPFDDLTRERCA